MKPWTWLNLACRPRGPIQRELTLDPCLLNADADGRHLIPTGLAVYAFTLAWNHLLSSSAMDLLLTLIHWILTTIKNSESCICTDNAKSYRVAIRISFKGGATDFPATGLASQTEAGGGTQSLTDRGRRRLLPPELLGISNRDSLFPTCKRDA